MKKKETENKTEKSADFSYPDPTCIPRSQHSISPEQIDVNARKVLSRLNEAGFASYLVGGGVRDLYLGKTPKDFDISTEARPGQLRKLFRNSRTIGRRFRLVQVFFPGNEIIEVSTFRCRSEYDMDKKDQVLAANNTFGSIADDAFRRDLTINSLFYDLTTEEIIDYTGGVEDLKKGIIRLIGEPERRIIRDPGRMLRVIRHAARSDFTIEDETWQAILKHRDKLHLCPISRVRDELFKDLSGVAGSKWGRLAIDCRLFFEIYPCYLYLLDEDKKGADILLDILAVADRLQGRNSPMPEPVLLGLSLIPWAIHYFPKLATKQKSLNFAYSLSREIRERLEHDMAHLNLKRVVRAHIADLISRLPLFAALDNGKNWPAYLKKKSYFQESSQFYMIYREAMGGAAVNSVNFGEKRNSKAHVGQKPKPRQKRYKGGGGPAFAPKGQKGGVFGLKKGKR